MQMLMPMPMTMPTWRGRDFQMVYNKFIFDFSNSFKQSFGTYNFIRTLINLLFLILVD